MLGRWGGRRRSLTDHLASLRRFLRSNVGPPWDQVHAEICEHVNLSNAVQRHVLTHVLDYVHRHVEERGETLVGSRARWGKRILRPGELYLCHRTGLLRVVGPPRTNRAPNRDSDGPRIQLHRRDGVWWQVTLRPFATETQHLWDVWLERDISVLTGRDVVAAYGGKLIAVAKRPLTRQEQRRLQRRLRRGSRRP